MPIRLAVALAILMGLVVAVPAASVITVVQRGLMLDRASMSLSRGDQMNFANEDDVIHNIHIFGPGPDDSVDLGLQKPGKLLIYKFEKPGAYKVRCNIHPSVKMAVTVQ